MDFVFEEKDPCNIIDDEGFALLQVIMVEGECIPLDNYVESVNSNAELQEDTEPSELVAEFRVVDIFDLEIDLNGTKNSDGSITFDSSFKPMVNAFKADLLTVLAKLNKINFN